MIHLRVKEDSAVTRRVWQPSSESLPTVHVDVVSGLLWRLVDYKVFLRSMSLFMSLRSSSLSLPGSAEHRHRDVMHVLFLWGFIGGLDVALPPSSGVTESYFPHRNRFKHNLVQYCHIAVNSLLNVPVHSFS